MIALSIQSHTPTTKPERFSHWTQSPSLWCCHKITDLKHLPPLTSISRFFEIALAVTKAMIAIFFYIPFNIFSKLSLLIPSVKKELTSPIKQSIVAISTPLKPQLSAKKENSFDIVSSVVTTQTPVQQIATRSQSPHLATPIQSTSSEPVFSIKVDQAPPYSIKKRDHPEDSSSTRTRPMSSSSVVLTQLTSTFSPVLTRPIASISSVTRPITSSTSTSVDSFKGWKVISMGNDGNCLFYTLENLLSRIPSSHLLKKNIKEYLQARSFESYV